MHVRICMHTCGINAVVAGTCLTRALLAGLPVALCTDDSSVFRTSLSREYALAMGAFHLSSQDIVQLVLQSVDMSFLPKPEKLLLRNHVVARMPAEADPPGGM